MSPVKNIAAHWDEVWQEPASAKSWYQDRPAVSLDLLGCGSGHRGSLVDVGGGASTLVDHLLDDGWPDLVVVDVAVGALEAAQRRLGRRADTVQWVEADVTTWQPARSFDWWHDRAVFHFQTPPESQHAYLATLERALAPTGHAVLATFADDGPEQCSGLATMRFDEATLTATVSPVLEPIRFVRETHTTPSGAAQSFLYGLFRRPNPEPSPKEP